MIVSVWTVKCLQSATLVALDQGVEESGFLLPDFWDGIKLFILCQACSEDES